MTGGGSGRREEKGGSSKNLRVGAEEGMVVGRNDLGRLARRSRIVRERRVADSGRRRRWSCWCSRFGKREVVEGEVGSWSGRKRRVGRRRSRRRSDEGGWRSSSVVVVGEVEVGSGRRGRRKKGREVRRRVLVASGRLGVRSRVPRVW